jgi:flagellar basal-body rod protein FlgC
MINGNPSAMFRSLRIAASGLTAQRQRLETIATNIANAETMRGPDGQPYRRRVVEMQPQAFAPGMPTAPTVDTLFAMATPEGAAGGLDATHGVDVAAVVEDTSEGPLVYDPGHPDADANGYVRYPNVQVTEEMVDLLDARRIYEANATVFQSAKAMLRRSLDI